MTKNEILNLYRGLLSLNKARIAGVKFAYAVNKNINILKSEIEALDEAKKFSEEFLAFDKERIIMAEANAKKDEKGKPLTATDPLTNMGSYVMENEAEFEVKFVELKEKHKPAIDARDVQVKEFEELLKTPSTVELHKLKIEDVPATITTDQMSIIMPILAE